MYPNGELGSLADRKARLLRQIAGHRQQCVSAVAELAVPLAAVDRGVATWRRISPWVKLLAVPGGLIAGRLLMGRSRGRTRLGGGRIAALVTAIPLVVRGARMAMNVTGALAKWRSTPPVARERASPGQRL